MGYEWFVSLRYLRAKRKQTFISVISFISIAGVTLGVAALILVLAVMTGFHDGVRKQILGNIPHVLVQKYGGALEDSPGFLDDLRQVSPHVVAVTPFVARESMLLANGNVSAVSLKGIPRSHKVLKKEFLSLDNQDVASLLFREDDNHLPGILVGIDTATALGVSLGDTINVIPPMFTMTPFGMIPKMKPFRVVGIFRQGGGFLDTFFAYVSLPQAQAFLDSREQLTGIEIDVDRYDHAAGVAEALRARYGFPYVIRSWEDMFGSFLSALKLEKLGLFIVLGIIVLVAAFNIASTLIMVVMEKNKDIAILRSMGATSRSIMKIFLFEGLVIGVVGTSLGTVFGLLLAWNADPVIKWAERTFGLKIFDQAVYGMDHFPSVVNSGDVLAVVAVSLGISLLATLYPAWHAARTDPAEALRYE
ncbi:lipoprotein-releasing system permease protein [Geothermobacter ehrlichii]|uniref:Lipoprotein-releasing system permease protein n=1 Tax=Geothermobacter ehrlichii TaxID=213224 RepID=A0A5D3WND9_9BACT|nr:lipoprotein-releasing ABC transporter permease subunit [Geothermobacter ehrlichii]TYP00035.1 lipoprotein-releasing system permease protein [Geothermobacter ehrlichii]